MNAKQKMTFIDELCHSIMTEAKAKVKEMPEEWDGIELRWYLADKFAASVYKLSGSQSDRTRRREYNNETIVRNL